MVHVIAYASFFGMFGLFACAKIFVRVLVMFFRMCFDLPCRFFV